jgi:lysine/ornithine N-monooxygenase
LTNTDVAIVGAGPYGLSIAAHLRRFGVDFRIFGEPTKFWVDIAQGATDRYLKSLSIGTNIYTPDDGYSFPEYCLKRGLESFEPCAIRDFANYGIWVQRNIVPNVEGLNVSNICRIGNAYHLSLSDGESVVARRVVLATGLTSFAVIPKELAQVPQCLVSHTSKIQNFQSLSGRDVCVIGGGQSALEAAKLLHDAGARPRLLVRDSQVLWNKRVPLKCTWWQKLRSPISGLGAGPKAWLLAKFPGAIHYAPERWRVRFVARHLPAEGAWWLRERVQKHVQISLNCIVTGAIEKDGRLLVSIYDRNHGEDQVTCDFIVAGTGFRADVDQLSFLSTELRSAVSRLERAPKLNRHFESSVPGLFFIGPSSALSFGPLYRFVVGASYAAPHLSAHLASTRA